MYCKKCGTEQKEGQNFCPNCGTPYIEMEQHAVEASSDELIVTEDQKEEKESLPEKDKKVKKSVKSKNKSQNDAIPAVINKDIPVLSVSDDEANKFRDFAIGVLKYMRRSKSERQISLYANRYAQTIQYCRQHDIDDDFVPYIFAEALRKLELEKSTTIYHIEANEIANCIVENKEGFTMRKKQVPKNNSQNSMGKYLIWGIIIVLILLVKMCGGCNGCESSSDDSSSGNYEQSSSSSSDSDDRAPGWIQGTWTCVTPYGNMQVEIVGDHIRELPGDGTSFYGTYHIDGDKIIPETGSHIYYKMDKSTQRLEAGHGYYFEKQ